MAVVTAFTAARMKEIEDSCIVNGAVDLAGDLTLERFDGSTFLAGNIMGPRGLQGVQGKTGPAGADADWEPIALDGVTNLNDVVTPGNYYQPLTAQASTARNYPKAIAGSLTVTRSSPSPTASQVLQFYTCYRANESWQRQRYNDVWEPWYKTVSEPRNQALTANWESGYAVTVHYFGVHGGQAYIDLGLERTGADLPNNSNGNITNLLIGHITNTEIYPPDNYRAQLTTTTTGFIVVGSVGWDGDVWISAFTAPGPSGWPTGYDIYVSGSWPIRK